MKKTIIIFLDLLLVIITFFLYSDFISKKYLGTEFSSVTIFSFLVFSIFLNLTTYFLALIINFFKKSMSFVNILYMIKLLFASIYFIPVIKSIHESKISEPFFIVCSLLAGGILQLFVNYFSEIKVFEKKIISYLERVWNDK